MDDQEPSNNPVAKKRRSRAWVLVLSMLLFLLLVAFLGIFFAFNYYGERFLRSYIQDKVWFSSHGLYRVDFRTVHVNILTGKVSVDSFELIPDTIQYQRLKAQGRADKALYRMSFSSLTIDRVHFRQIYAGKRINFRQLTMERPLLSIVGYPDTVSARRNKWKIIYEDLYPAVSGFFNDFHIDSVKVSHGRLLATFNERTGSTTTGNYEFSAFLKDVSVNPFSYYNRERVFYSRDIDLVVHNFESQLADSLYLLKADEIGFSLTGSVLYGKQISLRPNFGSKKIRQVRSGDLFRIDLPSFSIRGIDLYRAMTDRVVEISAVDLADFFIRVYSNSPASGKITGKKAGKKITIAGLYTVVAKELRHIAIDSLNLTNGSFEFYGGVSDSRPELRIGRVNLELNQFRLDSLAHLDQSRIFYAHAIELDLADISLRLRDGIHTVNASAISISTLKSRIDVQEATIFPNRQKNLLLTAGQRNTMFVNLPRLVFTGIDLKKIFNRRILDFDRLVIREPEIMYTRFRIPKNPDPRFKTPEDFFETENEDVVYELLKKYLWVVRGGEIAVEHGYVKYSADQYGREIPVATSSFDLTMQQFLIDSVHGMNEQGYFYSRDFNLNLQSLSIVSPDSLKHLQCERLHILTQDSLIDATNLKIYKSAEPQLFNARVKRRHSMTLEFSLRRLQLTGLNHKKLFLEKILKASQVVLDHPSLSLKTGNSLRPAGPPEEAQLLKTKTFVQSFEIGRFLVRKGAFSYDGEEDRKASYFSLRDIDFELVNGVVHVPAPGMHDGLIRFDTFQLKVIPLRAVLADSTYALEARSLEVHSYPADIILRGVKVSPLKSWNEMPGRKSMVTVTIPEIRFRHFYFDRAIFENEWLLEGVDVDHPMVEVEMQGDEGRGTWDVGRGTKDVGGGTWEMVRLPGFMKIVDIGNVNIDGAKAGLVMHRAEGDKSYFFREMMIGVNRFRVDDSTRSNPEGAPLFNAADISLAMPGISWISPDSLYTLAVGRIGFSTGASDAFLDSITVTPNYSRTGFTQKTGYQKDRIMLHVKHLSLAQVDFRKLVTDKKLHATTLSVDQLNIEDWLDKRLPFRDGQQPPMPAQMLSGIRFPVSIDTISLSNGFASYEEQTGDEPGRIFFDRMAATLTGFATPAASPSPSGWVDLHGSFRLMGVAPVDASIRFQRDHPRDTFTVRATIGKFDLTSLNPMLSKLLPAHIKEGTSGSTEITEMNANSYRAAGRLDFRYDNLSIKLHPTKPGTWHRVEQSLLSELVNLLLADSNPDEAGKMKYGVIYHERDSTRGFFNFVWKSVLSGIKSSVGVDSKTQKNIKKQLKQNPR